MLAEKKLSLIVWDCYRPKRAVDDFLRWSRDPAHAEMKAEFYPRTDKQRLFALGYLATRSAHSRGSTVDLGIVPSGFSLPPPRAPCRRSSRVPRRKAKGSRMARSISAPATIAWTPPASTSNPLVGATALRNRQLLKSTMLKAGFRPYAREWWHFELAHEPFNHGFDFEVAAPPSSKERYTRSPN